VPRRSPGFTGGPIRSASFTEKNLEVEKYGFRKPKRKGVLVLK
jgi:hypothetical protein